MSLQINYTIRKKTGPALGAVRQEGATSRPLSEGACARGEGAIQMLVMQVPMSGRPDPTEASDSLRKAC